MKYHKIPKISDTRKFAVITLKGDYLSARGAGQFFGKPVISSTTPRQIFISKATPQQQTVCNADPAAPPPPMAPPHCSANKSLHQLFKMAFKMLLNTKINKKK